MSWKVILGYNGVLNSGLMGLGIIDEPSTALLYNTSAVVITLTHAWAAFAVLPIFVSLEKIDRTLIEAATDLGDGPVRRFVRVVLPLSAPGIVSAILIVMIPTVGDFVTPRLVGGKDGVMIANAIQAQFGKASNWPLGAALSVTTMAIVTVMAGAIVLAIRQAARLAAMTKILEKWLPAYAFLYIVFLYLPVIFLPIFSWSTPPPCPKFPLSGFTWKWYAELPNTPALLDAAWNSLVVGVAAAILSTVLGICAARAITRYRFPGRTAINGLIMAPLVLPEIIVAISMLLVMLQLGLSLSLFTVVLGHVLICIPYSMTVLTSGFEGFDRSLEEASADLGESAFGTFRRVTLPMVAPAIISSLLVSFTISLDEFIMAFFLAGTDATLPV